MKDEIGDVSDLQVDLHAAQGGPAAAVLAAGDEATLIVVGSRGRGAASATFLGSVSSAVLREARAAPSSWSRGAGNPGLNRRGPLAPWRGLTG